MIGKFDFIRPLCGKVARGIRTRVLRNVIPHLLERSVIYSRLGNVAKKNHGLPAKLVVSLTSYPARFNKLPLTIKCLLSQTVAADHVILWVAHKDKKYLTSNVLNLQDYGVQISYCDDLRSYKKIIPTLTVHSDSFIVTADDDLYYWPTWLEELVRAYRVNSNIVVCHRAHYIRLAANNRPLPYIQWEHETTYSNPSALIFPTSGGGVLYPPLCFHDDISNSELFTVLAPTADDIWLYWMMRLRGYVARQIGTNRKFCSWPKTQQNALSRDNVIAGGNDRQIEAMIRRYGFPV